jgi:ABC-type polysaccharide/polyol phosphate transport system ATPase subunit
MAKIDLRNVSVEFPIYNVQARSLKKKFLRVATGGNISKDANQHVVVRSLDNISISINHGDRIGLIGHNGAGKSTFLKLLARIYEPTAGNIKIDGAVSPMLDLMSGIEAEFTGYENIMIRGTILGLSKRHIKDQMIEIAEFTGLGDYLAMPVRTYSSGMMVRLAFAISTCIKPDIMLIDEVFGAGDASFMQKARGKLVSMLNQSSIVVIASHANELISEFCNKALLLDSGRISYFGDIETAMDIYQKTGTA